MISIEKKVSSLSGSENISTTPCSTVPQLHSSESSNQNDNYTTTVKSASVANVLLKLFYHSVAMFTLPFMTYFGIKNYAENEYDIQSPRSFVYGIIGAVIVVQFIIASYVYQAMKEERENRQLMKKVS